MNDEFLSIQDFAAIVGLKPQGIYKQASNEKSRLYPYVVYHRGKRYIKKEALKEVYQIEQTEKQTIQPEEKQVPPQEEPKEKTEEEKAEESPAAMIEYLKEQLRTRDREIAELHRLLFNEQELHKKDTLLLLEYQEKEKQEAEAQTPPPQEDVIDAVIEDTEAPPQEEKPQEVQEEKKKENVFVRAFRVLFGGRTNK